MIVVVFHRDSGRVLVSFSWAEPHVEGPTTVQVYSNGAVRPVLPP